MEYNHVIKDAFLFIKKKDIKGSIASYIPELQNIDPNKFGVFYQKIDGESYGQGDYQERFSIQSIAKVLSTTLAYSLVGEKLW